MRSGDAETWPTQRMSECHWPATAAVIDEMVRCGICARPGGVPPAPDAETVRDAIKQALDIKGMTDPVARRNWESSLVSLSQALSRP